MKDQFWPFAECWDGWRGVRIGSPVVVSSGWGHLPGLQGSGGTDAEGRRWPSAECKISCRLHDGAVLGNRILRSSMRTPRVRGGGSSHVAERYGGRTGRDRSDRCPADRKGGGSGVTHPASAPQASLPTALTAHARWLSIRNQRVTATYAAQRISTSRTILRSFRRSCPGTDWCCIGPSITFRW